MPSSLLFLSFARINALFQLKHETIRSLLHLYSLKVHKVHKVHITTYYYSNIK